MGGKKCLSLYALGRHLALAVYVASFIFPLWWLPGHPLYTQERRGSICCFYLVCLGCLFLSRTLHLSSRRQTGKRKMGTYQSLNAKLIKPSASVNNPWQRRKRCHNEWRDRQKVSLPSIATVNPMDEAADLTDFSKHSHGCTLALYHLLKKGSTFPRLTTLYVLDHSLLPICNADLSFLAGLATNLTIIHSTFIKIEL